jgi:hypothetical protein
VRTPIKGSLSKIESLNPSNIKIYPNPAKSNIFVFSEGKGNVEIFDFTGKTCIAQSINNEVESISLSGISSGIYAVKVSVGAISKTQKIVIE